MERKTLYIGVARYPREFLGAFGFGHCQVEPQSNRAFRYHSTSVHAVAHIPALFEQFGSFLAKTDPVGEFTHNVGNNAQAHKPPTSILRAFLNFGRFAVVKPGKFNVAIGDSNCTKLTVARIDLAPPIE